MTPTREQLAALLEEVKRCIYHPQPAEEDNARKKIDHVIAALSTPPPAPTDEAAPDAVEGQCPRCGERDGSHAADCLDWRCDHCGHDRESHREGVASRLERDGRFHTCRAEVASPSPERCGYIHVDGWTCGRAKGHPSVHVPPSRMANPPRT